MFEQNKIAKVFEACEGSGCDGYLIARISDQVEFFCGFCCVVQKTTLEPKKEKQYHQKIRSFGSGLTGLHQSGPINRNIRAMEGVWYEMWCYVHPDLVWWDEDREGPIHHRELMCQFCNDYLVAVHVTEYHTSQSVWVCHICGAFLLLCHGRFWELADMYWT